MIKEGYTRVTEIISWCKKHDLAEIDESVLFKKAQLGSKVHEAIDSFLFSGLFVPLDEKEQRYFDSFKKWHDSCEGLRVKEAPGRLYCDAFKITGEIDLLAVTKDSKMPCIIDFKTSAQEDKIGWPLQGIFYKHLCDINHFQNSDQFMFLKLDKDGKMPQLKVYEYSELLWSKAMSCLKAFRVWHGGFELL